MASEQRNSEDERHRSAFGEHTGISDQCRESINRIMNNDPYRRYFVLGSGDAGKFTAMAWELLGGYIANNDHLQNIDLSRCGLLTDSKMSLLFRRLSKGGSLVVLDLERDDFGIDGIRSMVPFLKNAHYLTQLKICNNRNITTECFRVLVEALHAEDRSKHSG